MSLEAFDRIAVVGATGAVGREALAILAERGVSAERIVALASARSAGSALAYGEGEVVVGESSLGAVCGCDAALLCADAQTARALGPAAAALGATVVDNSSAFRMAPGVPLVVPEVNGDLLDAEPTPRLIANPNCSTVILLCALEPLKRAFGVERVIVSTYQAVSGAGLAGIEELRRQTRAALEGEALAPEVFPETCGFNLFPHESAVDGATGLNGEEAKIVAESRRIWGEAGLRIEPTCVRVPVERAHSQSVTVDLGAAATEDEVRAALRAAPWLEVIDDRAGGVFPTPRKATGRDEVLVGRVRVGQGGRTVSLWVCGDQLRKGAALNAVQVLERAGRERCGFVRQPGIPAAGAAFGPS